jgi:hypothetical protein
MKGAAFVILVDRMRIAQKAYFKRRSQDNLKASIELEQQVDQALQEGIEIPEVPKQLDMFATQKN